MVKSSTTNKVKSVKLEEKSPSHRQPSNNDASSQPKVIV